MNNYYIGANISELRKEKAITQETLAEAVGVTGQSVSKWEVGGSPDAMLLPVIADYFGVSIDRLYGRKSKNSTDLIAGLAESIVAMPEGKRLTKVYEYCRELVFAISGGMFTTDMFEHMLREGRAQALAHGSEADIRFGRIETTDGAVILGLTEKLPYIMILPEPEEGWADSLCFSDEHVKLFEFLADPDALGIMFFLYQREENTAFTSKLTGKRLGISQAKAEEILATLQKYKYVTTGEVEMDDETVVIYHASPHLSFLPFLIFASEVCQRTNAEFVFVGQRDKPYLWQKKEASK